MTTSDGEVPVPSEARRALVLRHRDLATFLTVCLFDDGTAPEDASYDVAVAQLEPAREPRFARVGTHHGDRMRDVSPAPLVGLKGLAGLMMLIDRATGTGLGFLLFDSEDALQRGDAFVAAADPGTAGPTTSVDFYDVVRMR